MEQTFPEKPEYLNVALNYDNIRAELAKEITKAEILKDLRSIVILCRRFTDAFPAGKLAPIDKAIKILFLKKLTDAKYHYTHFCPVCNEPMTDTLCPDDIVRPYCFHCQKTYTPMGYDCDDNYGKKWSAVSWSQMVEERRVIEIQ